MLRSMRVGQCHVQFTNRYSVLRQCQHVIGKLPTVECGTAEHDLVDVVAHAQIVEPCLSG